MEQAVYIWVDLSAKSAKPYPIPKVYCEKYIGGKCLAARLLLDLTQAGTDPLSPEAMLIVNTGPMNGTGAPSSSRFNMSFKNVLTGGIASSNSGGQFGVMLRKAGYEGLILTGRAETPTLIEILDGEVQFTDATALWGLNVEEVQAQLPKPYGKLVIGPAGEHLVRYASIASGERMSGRCGCGAVFGSKNVKAVVAYGTRQIPVWDRAGLKAFTKKWVTFLRKHPMTGESLPRYGSGGLVNKANAAHALPTHNFKYGHDDQADAVSGETMTETLLVRNGSCVSCPIRCERRVMVDGKEVKGPEYETLGLFGPNIDAHDLDMIVRLNYLCDLYGMDTISCASSIAYAMEMKEQGLHDFGVSFADTESLERTVQMIALREGAGADLAEGTKRMSEKYGGKGFAMHAKGLEMASYEPRRSVGMGLGYAVSNRGGCHLNGGYLALLESVGVLSLDAQSPKAKAEFTVFMQDCLEAVSCAGHCLFSAQTFVPAILYRLGPTHPITRLVGKIATHLGWGIRLLLRLSNLLQFNSLYLLPHAEALHLVTGLRMKTAQFIKLGERSYNLERLYSLREGLGTKDDTLPDRLTKTPQDPACPDTVVPLEKMLPRYYKTRGWDAHGVPTEKTRKRLGIQREAES